MIEPTAIFYWMSVLGWGFGIGLLVYALGSGLAVLASRRRSRKLNTLTVYDRDALNTAEKTTPHISQDALIGLDNIPWITIYLAAALAGFGIAAFINQFWPVLIALTPFLLRTWLQRYRNRGLMQTMWQFLVELRIRLALSGTLLRALQDVADHSKNPISQVIRIYLDAGYRESGIDLLRHVRDDLPNLPFLSELLSRAEAATSGTLSMDDAVRQVMDNIQREAATQARENIQQIPSRLIIMAFPALLVPALFLLVTPLAARLIASLQGTTWGGGW